MQTLCRTSLGHPTEPTRSNDDKTCSGGDLGSGTRFVSWIFHRERPHPTGAGAGHGTIARAPRTDGFHSLQNPATHPSPAESPQPAPPKVVLAEDVFKNVQTFKGMPAVRVIPAMVALTGLLGVECSYCHTPYEWDKDDKEPKKTARKMFKMMKFIDHDYFDSQGRVSCWTCHAGYPKPQGLAPDPAYVEMAEGLIKLPASDETKPAEQVFKNIQTLQGVPAGRFPMIMAFFSRSLGVRCSHCHVPGAWDRDDLEAKKTARKMLAMVGTTIQRYYGQSGPIGCFARHHGAAKPTREPEPAKGSSETTPKEEK